MEFKENLRQKMVDLGFSHEDLAIKIWGKDSKKYIISSYLKGDDVPTGKELIELAKVMGITANDLLEDGYSKPSRLKHVLESIPEQPIVKSETLSIEFDADMAFRDRLKLILDELGDTPYSFATRVWGVGNNSVRVSEYLNGVTVPTWSTIKKMAVVLNIDPNDLAGSTEGKNVSRHQNALAFVPKDDVVKHYIYVIECEKYVKIGITKNMSRRLSNMKSNNPYPFKVILQTTCYSESRVLRVESLAHAVMCKWSHSGEWFKVDDEESRDTLIIAMEKIERYSLEEFEGVKSQTPNAFEFRKDETYDMYPPGVYAPDYLHFCKQNELNPKKQETRISYRESLKF